MKRMAAISIAMSIALSACTHETSTASAPPAEPTRGAEGQAASPPRMDDPRLTSEAPEPSGPGTQLGPHTPVTIAAAAGLPTHTVYHPADLSRFSPQEPLPILVWGNGACRNDGRRFEGTLTKVASHGFLVVAVGLFEPREGAPSTTGAQMVEGIDWTIAANAAGPLAGKLDTGKIAVMGQSCGGLMTIEAAHDPRIATIGVINSGVYNRGPGTGLSITTATKDTLATIHTPTLYINGGEADLAWPNSNDDVSRINNVPVFYGAMNGAGHIATHRHRNGGVFAEVITGWLEFQLKGDAIAAKMFVGPSCGLCVDPAWTVIRKGM